MLHHDNNPEACLLELKEIIDSLKVEGLVLGFPKNMNNSLGPRAEETLKFKKRLEDEFKLPVYLEDERLTTVSANNLLIMGNERRSKRKKVVDKVAATIILQTYLDMKGNSKNGK